MNKDHESSLVVDTFSQVGVLQGTLLFPVSGLVIFVKSALLTDVMYERDKVNVLTLNEI